MLKEQDGKCAICQCKPSKTLHLDHNHSTGKVRALLCQLCNHAIGLLKEQPEVLKRAATYLERYA
jgi:hypothetical protein